MGRDRFFRAMLSAAAMIAWCTVAGTAAAAASFDCARAGTRTEKAICADSALAAADHAMAMAYRALSEALPPGERPQLLRAQRDWARSRDRNCGYNKAVADFAKCLLATTRFRTEFLAAGTATTENGARIGPSLFHEERPGSYEITVIYPVARGGNPAAAAKFNDTAQYIAIGDRKLDEFRAATARSVPNTFSESYRLAQLGGNVVSLLFSTESYAGGAHGSSDRVALLFDLARGQKIGFDRLLNNPAQALPAISELCKKQLQAEAARGGWENMLWFNDPKMNADPMNVVKDVQNWFVQPQQVEILFGNYTIGPYAIGMHECHLAYSDLAPWINKKGPLASMVK